MSVIRFLRMLIQFPVLLLLGGAHGDAIGASDAAALIPEEVSKEIMEGAVQQSTVMRLATRLPNMSRSQHRLPVLSGLPIAYFVGSTGLKKSSKQAWENKYIYAEELAVIVPIEEKLLDDADYDIWGAVKPRLIEAFGLKFDAAVFYAAADTPATWPSSILTGATAAGHVVALGTGVDMYDDIMTENGTLTLVEQDGFMVNGHIGALSMMARLRGLRDANGRPIFVENIQNGPAYMLNGSSILFPINGAVDPTQSLLISGDWKQAVFSIRQDITWKVLDQAVIQDEAGNILYNLAQQDMVALRAVMRLGWQLPNPINRVTASSVTRYPFAVLTPA